MFALFDNLPIKVFLPFILLGISFLLKFFIGREKEAYDLIKAILEIPTSFLFISLSLLAAHIISDGREIQDAYIFSLILIGCLVLGIVFWKRSVKNLENKKFWFCFWWGVFNLGLSFPLMVYCINFLIVNT